MNLPKRNKRHQYEIELSNKTIKFTPWLVKHEQEYMYAIEGSKDEEEIIQHIEELLSKCVDEDIDFGEMTDFDFLKFAIEVRKKSKGSEHEVVYTCRNCNHVNAGMIIDLETDVIINEVGNEPIIIDELELTIRSLTRNELLKIKELDSPERKKWMFILYSIKSIASGNEIYANFSEDDIQEFLGTELSNDEFSVLVKGITSRQSDIAVETTFKCEKCDHETLIYVDKIIDFFL